MQRTVIETPPRDRGLLLLDLDTGLMDGWYSTDFAIEMAAGVLELKRSRGGRWVALCLLHDNDMPDERGIPDHLWDAAARGAQPTRTHGEGVREMQVGDHVTFVDQHGLARPALVTHMHGGGRSGNPSINVVIVSDDPERDDSYGRQIERETSVPHQEDQGAPGYFWR